MIYRHGQFVWRELLTSDTDKSLRFYSEVLGYKAQTAKMPDGSEYTMLVLGDQPVAGMMKRPMPEIPPHWSVYVSVDDVDAAAKRAAEAGGKVVAGPMDAGGFGRFATMLDPAGGAISAWKSAQGDGERAKDYRPRVGEFCWEQLNAADPSAVEAFYKKVFGWGQRPFEGGGDMTVFTAGDAAVASVMKAPPGVPTHWLTYVVVDTLADARRRVEAQGGKTMVERIDVPTVGAISVVSDNVGAMLGLFEAPKG